MIFIVAGARPNFMKIVPIVKELKNRDVAFKIIHTGQHYEKEMSGFFFDDLDLPEPDIHLGINPGSHAQQTAKIMVSFEKVCLKEIPDLVVVVGDVNSTLACALVAAKLCIPIAHVEAGLRSFDRTMPEEINRVLTDQISDFLFTSCMDANRNLLKEGIQKNKIFFVGNVMIDTLLNHLNVAKTSTILKRLGLRKNNRVKKYALLTLHRPSNVDGPQVLKRILKTLNIISKKIPVIFPCHPRTLRSIRKFKLFNLINYADKLEPDMVTNTNQRVSTIPPLGYLDFLCLMSMAAMVFTDSGGIQEETTVLGIPCLTLRENTERPVTVKQGTNFLVGTDPDKIIKKAMSVLKDGTPRKKVPKYWDGRAAERIVKYFDKYVIK
jgi:UDP-N-acetylglucosamine 2-epimerase (non-hydrolysing)